MYRCFACDSPPQFNCDCHTQVETPSHEAWPERAVRPTFAHKILVASGEDANMSAYPAETME